MPKKSPTKYNKVSLAYFSLLLVLLMLIFGTGLYIWSKRDLSSKTQPSSASAQITNYDECVAAGYPVMESYPEQCAANGKTYTNTTTQQQKTTSSINNRFSLELPGGWKVEKDTQSDHMRVTDYMSAQHKAGSSATVVERAIGGSDSRNIFVIFTANEDYQGWTDDTADKTSFTLQDGTKGTRYTQNYPDTQEGLGGAAKGEIRYEYLFKKGDTYVHAAYTVIPPENNQVEVLEAALRTLVIN